MKTAQGHNDDIVQLLCNRVVAQMVEIERLRGLVADIAMGLPLDPGEQEMLDRIINRKDRW